MFKRLIAAFRRSKQRTDNAQNATPPQDNGENEVIVAYDSYGREIKILRSEWRTGVFLPSLQQHWNNADELYNAIVSGLDDGFISDLLPAAKQLLDIDHIPERSHVINGIVLMKNNQLAAAEITLQDGIAKAGATGTLLTNLAKVFSARGDEARAEQTLWQALQQDPNQDTGLQWWLSLQQERRGSAGYQEALQAVAALPGSWRAQLWLARAYLEQKQVTAAVELYRYVLDSGLFDSDALLMISGDLGNHGELHSVIELIAPRYNEHTQPPGIGLNLLQAYHSLQQIDAGEKLLARLYALNLPPYRPRLDEFNHIFQQQRCDEDNTQTTPPQISTLTIEQPIWHYGLCHPEWLFQQKNARMPQVGFFAFSMVNCNSSEARTQSEDDLGKMTRALPLYLAESVHYWSDNASRCYFQIAEGYGPAVTNHCYQGSDFFDIVPPDMSFFVTGEVEKINTEQQEQWKISLHLWNCTTRSLQTTENIIAGWDKLAEGLISLEKRLLAHLGHERQHPFDNFYQRPSVTILPTYLHHLAQSLILTLVANQQAPSSSLWGERNMLENPLHMALEWPDNQVPDVMYFSAVGKAFYYHSTALPEYQQRSLTLLQHLNDVHSPLASLAPWIWKIFAIAPPDNWAEHHPITTEDYRAWLIRVEEAKQT